MKKLLETMVKGLVDDTDQIEIEEVEEERATILELRVAPDELGKVIGRRGRTAGAMRAILSAAAAKQKTRINLEILD